jgi:Icc-related predicted phosphoesterase
MKAGVRVHVVSDVHGNTDALARAGDGADALVVLGDLLDFVDYHDHSGGIIGRIFGPAAVRRFAELRSSSRGNLRAFAQSLWAQLDDPEAVIEQEAQAQYERIFASLTAPTFATPGNVDLPDLWPEFAGNGVTICDGTVADIGGRRFGFVGGALTGTQDPFTAQAQRSRRRPWLPYVRTPSQYRAAVAALAAAGAVDVLASHIPPAVPELCYDVVARYPERGSPQLLEFIRSQRPALALFGHVHQPLARRMRVARTECVNVGHFQRTATPYVLTW